jgi:hypothetical protein
MGAIAENSDRGQSLRGRDARSQVCAAPPNAQHLRLRTRSHISWSLGCVYTVVVSGDT